MSTGIQQRISGKNFLHKGKEKFLLAKMNRDEQEKLLDSAARELAEVFYETSERLSPLYGVDRKNSALAGVSWKNISEGNPHKQLLIATCKEVLLWSESI